MSPLPCPFSLQPHHLRLRNIDRSDPASDFFDFHFYHIGCNTMDSMKYADLEKIFQAGLISQEQRDQIATHFDLKEEKSRFLTIVSFIARLSHPTPRTGGYDFCKWLIDNGWNFDSCVVGTITVDFHEFLFTRPLSPVTLALLL